MLRSIFKSVDSIRTTFTVLVFPLYLCTRELQVTSFPLYHASAWISQSTFYVYALLHVGHAFPPSFRLASLVTQFPPPRAGPRIRYQHQLPFVPFVTESGQLFQDVGLFYCRNPFFNFFGSLISLTFLFVFCSPPPFQSLCQAA